MARLKKKQRRYTGKKEGRRGGGKKNQYKTAGKESLKAKMKISGKKTKKKT